MTNAKWRQRAEARDRITAGRAGRRNSTQKLGVKARIFNSCDLEGSVTQEVNTPFDSSLAIQRVVTEVRDVHTDEGSVSPLAAALQAAIE